MTVVQALPVYAWADNAYREAGCRALPIDLHAIARWRSVKAIRLRLMVHDGAVVPIPGGFDVYLFDMVERDLDVQSPEPAKALTVRQRFTLAHEIAHTHFYSAKHEVPISKRKVKVYGDEDEIGLEIICNRAAARLLVPKHLLKEEIRRVLKGETGRIDIPFVRLLADKFRVSDQVMIDRLSVVFSDNSFARCIALIENDEGVYKVATNYVGGGLISAFQSAEDYPPLFKWFPEFPADLVHQGSDLKVEQAVRKRRLQIQKAPIGRSGGFLLQIDDLDHLAPNSM